MTIQGSAFLEYCIKREGEGFVSVGAEAEDAFNNQ